MKVTKKELDKSQVELLVELSLEEFKPYIKKGATEVSKETKIEGFRPGNVPYDVLKQKVGEMTILEQAVRLAINKTIGQAIEENIKEQPIGQPEVSITKIAPNNPIEYKIVLSILPKITLGKYKDLKIKTEEIKIEPVEIDKTLTQLLEMRVKEIISDQPAKDTGKVLINLDMFLDRVPVEGGQSKDTAIIIGKNYLVPGFDKKLLGAKKGDKREFSLPFPKDHHQKNLAGKLVDFKVEIKEIYERQIPKADDEFAKGLGAKNLDELKNNLGKNIESEKKQASEQKEEMAIIEKILTTTNFTDIPEMLISSEGQAMMAELEQTITSQGGKFEDYLSSMKKTREQLTLDLLPNAIKRVKSALLVREIAKIQKIQVSPEEIDKKKNELLEQYKGYEKVIARVKEPNYKAYLANTLTNTKVIKKLKEWNLEKQ